MVSNISRLALFCCLGPFAYIAFAQPTVKSNSDLRIGVLLGGSPTTSTHYLDTLREALRALGYVEGRNLAIEPRFAAGDFGRLPALADELAEKSLDLIVAANEPALLAAKRAKKKLPIVVVACDPLDKLMGSLAQPGGNATGVTCVSSILAAKRFGYLSSMVPTLKRVALLYSSDDNVDLEMEGAEKAGRALGIQVIRFPVRSPDNFPAVFAAIVQQDVRALYVSVSAFTNFHRQRLADLAIAHRLPAINGFPEFAEAGGLISYGATLTDAFTRAAYFIDRIAKGASPKDLPVEEPTKFYLVVNAKTAAKLGINIPDSILLQADTVLR